MASSEEPEYLLPREIVHTVMLSEADPAWADAYAVEEARIRAALHQPLVEVHHVGSTSVPGLAAKPILDIVLLVADSTAEDGYVQALQAAGYAFHLREPHWHRHRLFKRGTPHFGSPAAENGEVAKVNLHVFSAGCSEARRMLMFRDWLRMHPHDRELYEGTKRMLAGRQWTHVQEYADAKSAVVTDILRRASG
jgi:GrpB-like predicted nucleotidyltransferase (UPF0157 family)